jgi:hypothetical protein
MADQFEAAVGGIVKGVSDAATELASQSETLRAEMQRFLTTVRAA